MPGISSEAKCWSSSEDNDVACPWPVPYSERGAKTSSAASKRAELAGQRRAAHRHGFPSGKHSRWSQNQKAAASSAAWIASWAAGTVIANVWMDGACTIQMAAICMMSRQPKSQGSCVLYLSARRNNRRYHKERQSSSQEYASPCDVLVGPDWRRGQ